MTVAFSWHHVALNVSEWEENDAQHIILLVENKNPFSLDGVVDGWMK